MTLRILNEQNGRSFNVRLLWPGEKYGLRRQVEAGKEGYLNGREPMDEFQVEIFDCTREGYRGHTDDPLGQFTGGRYYASTLLVHDPGYGLNMDGGTPAWSISAMNMTEVKHFIERGMNLIRDLLDRGYTVSAEELPNGDYYGYVVRRDGHPVAACSTLDELNFFVAQECRLEAVRKGDRMTGLAPTLIPKHPRG